MEETKAGDLGDVGAAKPDELPLGLFLARCGWFVVHAVPYPRDFPKPTTAGAVPAPVRSMPPPDSVHRLEDSPVSQVLKFTDGFIGFTQ